VSRSRSASREDRRRADLEERRARRRQRRTQQPQRSRLLPLTLGALALGVGAVIVFAVVTAPPAPVDLREPAGPLAYPQSDGQALGPADAPVVVEIYSDFQCPACATLATSVKPLLIAEYVDAGQVRLIYRDFAFLGAESISAAIGARCAADQNRFWQYHDYLFANQQGQNRGAFSTARLDAIAETVGLDMATYQACVADPAQRQAVLDERSAAGAVPIESTPTLVIDGEQRVVGVPDYNALREALNARLAQAEAP
jgi:protein-disulfide isomerase